MANNPIEDKVLDRRRFDLIIGMVLKHEGGYVNDPVDPGGETKYGISKRSYPFLDIKNLTLEQAKEIYYNEWYRALGLNKVESDAVAQKILDLCVNVGKKTGVKLVQVALNDIGKKVELTGLLCVKTLEAINKSNSALLLANVRNRHAEHYRKLIDKNPKLEKYANGWRNRAYA